MITNFEEHTHELTSEEMDILPIVVHGFRNYKKDNPNILSKSLELLRLKRSKEIYENIYNILLEKAEEQRILSASSGAGIKTVDIALTTRQGTFIRSRCIARPIKHRVILLQMFRLHLPQYLQIYENVV